MHCECPEVARCCFCFPLRFGLLVWAYAKLAFIIFLLCSLFWFVLTEYVRMGYFIKYELPLFVIANIFTIFFYVDIIFHVVFIISAHTKEYRKMNMFYKEALFGFGLYLFGFVFSFLYLFVNYTIIGLFIGITLWVLYFWLIVTQAYIIILVRSEVLKLEKSQNFQFTNLTMDVENAKSEANDVA